MKLGLLAKIREDAAGCWVWTGSRSAAGYGSVNRAAYGTGLAHRVVYSAYTGTIPAGLDLDHLCRNRACVNPAHLEPVTRKENLRRGLRGSITHCPAGHEYDAMNTYIRPGGQRKCRACNRIRERMRKSPEKPA